MNIPTLNISVDSNEKNSTKTKSETYNQIRSKRLSFITPPGSPISNKWKDNRLSPISPTDDGKNDIIDSNLLTSKSIEIGSIGTTMRRSQSFRILDLSDEEDHLSNTKVRNSPEVQSLSSKSSQNQHMFNRVFPQFANETLEGARSANFEKDVMWHGKIFFTKYRICFYGKSNSKAVKMTIPWHNILSMEKKSTAGMFSNSIKLMTLHSKHVFSSIAKRDQLFSKIQSLWEAKIHPNQDSNGEIFSQKTQKISQLQRLEVSPTRERSATSPVGIKIQALPSQNNDSRDYTPTPLPMLNAPGSNDNLSMRHFESQKDSGDVAMDENHSLNKSGTRGMVTVIPSILKGKGSASSPHISRATFSKKKRNATKGIMTNTGDLVLPNKPVFCNCSYHQKFVIVDEVVHGIDVRQTAALLYESSGFKFISEFESDLGGYVSPFVDWEFDGGLLRRERSYFVNYKPPMLASTLTKYSEKQINLKSSAFEAVVEGRGKLSNVPYCDNFEIITRICLTYFSTKSTRILVTFGVNFNKHILWEAKITKSCIETYRSFYNDLVNSIRHKIIVDPKFIQTLPKLYGKLPQENRTNEAQSKISTNAESLEKSKPLLRSFRLRWLNISILALCAAILFMIYITFFNLSEYIEITQKSWNIQKKLGINSSQMYQLLDKTKSPVFVPTNKKLHHLTRNVHRHQWIIAQEEAKLDVIMEKNGVK